MVLTTNVVILSPTNILQIQRKYLMILKMKKSKKKKKNLCLHVQNINVLPALCSILLTTLHVKYAKLLLHQELNRKPNTKLIGKRNRVKRKVKIIRPKPSLPPIHLTWSDYSY